MARDDFGNLRAGTPSKNYHSGPECPSKTISGPECLPKLPLRAEMPVKNYFRAGMPTKNCPGRNARQKLSMGRNALHKLPRDETLVSKLTLLSGKQSNLCPIRDNQKDNRNNLALWLFGENLSSDAILSKRYSFQNRDGSLSAH